MLLLGCLNLFIALASILGVAILALLVVFLIAPAVSEKEPVDVPDCKGVTVSTCEKKLKKEGFVVGAKIKSIYSDSVRKNRVVKTSPAAGRSIKPGTTVTIYKSKGEESFKIDNYVGKNYSEVKAKLELKMGLNVTVEKKEVNEAPDDSNLIIEQSVPAGTKLRKGDSITLYIPNLVEKFPNMVAEGWSRDDAEAFAKKYGLNIKVVEEATTEAAPGIVIMQSRAAGTSIVKGSNLTVTIAKAPVVPTPTQDEKKEEDKESSEGGID